MSIGDGIGKRIRETREQRRMSVAQLARESEVTTTAVWNWEHSQIAPRFNTLAKVAACLGVSEEFLRTGVTDRESNPGEEAKLQSVSEMIEELRAKIAQATGFALDRVKLHLELVAD